MRPLAAKMLKSPVWIVPSYTPGSVAPDLLALARRLVEGPGGGEPDLIWSRPRAAVVRGTWRKGLQPAVVKTRAPESGEVVSAEAATYRLLGPLADVFGLPPLLDAGVVGDVAFIVLGDLGLPDLATAGPTLTDELRSAAVASAAERLRRIHRAPIPDGLMRALGWADADVWLRKLRGSLRVGTDAIGSMGTPQAADVVRSVEPLLASVPRWTGPPALLHGDYGAPNLLVDPGTGEVRSVIDWEWAAIGDPAFDLAKVRLEARAGTASRVVDAAELEFFAAAYGDEGLDRWADPLLGLAHVVPLLVALLRALPPDHHGPVLDMGAALVAQLANPATA